MLALDVVSAWAVSVALIVAVVAFAIRELRRSPLRHLPSLGRETPKRLGKSEKTRGQKPLQ